MSNEQIKCGRNSQHSILAFQKEKNASWKSNLKGISPTFMLASLLFFNCFGSWCIDGRYGRYYMSDFPPFYSKESWWKWPIVLLELLGIFFRILTFIGEG